MIHVLTGMIMIDNGFDACTVTRRPIGQIPDWAPFTVGPALQAVWWWKPLRLVQRVALMMLAVWMRVSCNRMLPPGAVYWPHPLRVYA